MLSPPTLMKKQYRNSFTEESKRYAICSSTSFLCRIDLTNRRVSFHFVDTSEPASYNPPRSQMREA